jgi:hypothetical protein
VTTSGRALNVDVEIGRLLYPGPAPRRPHQRIECGQIERPCPYVGCRYHLYLDVRSSGAIAETWPTREPWELASTCSLDVADEGAQTLDQVAELLGGVSRERVRQIEVVALRKLKHRAPGLLEHLEGRDA